MFGAIKTIPNMVLISIHPFAVRKLFLFIVAFLCFSAFCLADPVLMVRRYSIRPDRPVSPKSLAATSEQFFRSDVLLAQTNASDNGIAPNRTNYPARPGGFGSAGVSSSGLSNPACVRRSLADSLDEPAALRLRKI